MKNLKDFITEKQNFLIKNKDVLKDYNKHKYYPKTKKDLKDIIIDLLNQGETNLNCIDVSEIKDMSNLFQIIKLDKYVPEIDISEWNVYNVTNMDYMFFGCESFNSDLSDWDVSNVESLIHTFNQCELFNSDLSNWNVSKVKNMNGLFALCKEFNSDLSNWNVSKVKNMTGMFYNCIHFNSDLSKWDVSNVENMSGLFNGCEEFNYDLSNWNISKETRKNHVFKNCKTLIKNNKIPKWYTGKI